MSAKGQEDPGEDQDSRVEADNYWSNMKRAIAKQLIERYFYQLTEGCGNSDCDNQNCASSGKVRNLTPNQAAAQAIQLFSQEARLCDGTQPSKVARTTLESSPASLTKSLPVKSVNPTCSDEDDFNQDIILTEIGQNICRVSKIQNCKKFYPNVSDISVNSEDSLLKVLSRYRIQVPYHSANKIILEQSINHRGIIKRPRRFTKRSRNSKKKFNITYCSRSLTKLLVLALCLKHIEATRYSNYIEGH